MYEPYIGGLKKNCQCNYGIGKVSIEPKQGQGVWVFNFELTGGQ